ncbi:hypothetical protein ACIPSE_45830 [Streptomyces sp. NPDC090106]|uniref:hypothetical protein n=1 Tax=Streptomyces sp. NPDC090106 TaxID=3365946 RepID=UPI00380EEB83
MLYSCLNVSAAVLDRRGDNSAARAYSTHAQRLEDELVELLNQLSVDRAELEPLANPSGAAWKALGWLCTETGKALASLPAVPDEERFSGVLKSTDGKKVLFVEAGSNGMDRELPYGMLESAGLSIGDPALLTNEFTGEAIITRLQPGLLTDDLEDSVDDVTDDRVGRSLGDENFAASLFDELRAE